MATGIVGGHNGTNPDNLKQLYETALEELSGEKPRLVRPNTPICRRPIPGAVTKPAASPERALEDAANALAALWRSPKSKQVLRPKR